MSLAEAKLILTKYVASSGVNRKGDGEEVALSLPEAEWTLAECALLLVGCDRREHFLGKRIVRYSMLMGQRGGSFANWNWKSC